MLKDSSTYTAGEEVSMSKTSSHFDRIGERLLGRCAALSATERLSARTDTQAEGWWFVAKYSRLLYSTNEIDNELSLYSVV